MKNVLDMKKLFERKIKMRKLLLLVFVAVMCVPSYGSILVYKTTSTATVFTGDVKATEKETGYLVLDVVLPTQDVNDAQYLTYSNVTKTKQTVNITVRFTSPGDYIAADYSNGDADAVLFGKTADGKAVGFAGENVAKSLKGSMVIGLNTANLGSGTFSATLDTAKTKLYAGHDVPYVTGAIADTLTKYSEAAADLVAPTPSPMTFATVPTALSNTQITMTATTATDATSPPVEYYFTNVTDSSHNSGWKSATADSTNWTASTRTWIDTGLTPDTNYTYNVKAQDNAAPNANSTVASANATAKTSKTADSNAPTPNPMTWAAGGEPNALSDTQITMTATTAIDAQGVEYFFTNVTDTNHNSGWQDSTTFLDRSLNASTKYSYNVKARDKSLSQNTTATSTPNDVNATTLADTSAPTPNPMTFEIAPYSAGPTSITMRATTAADACTPYYQFRWSTGGLDIRRTWGTDANFTDTGLVENSLYSYQVQAGDAATTGGHTTAWSAASATVQTSKTIRARINEAKVGRTDFATVLVVTIPDGTYNENLEINEPNMTLQSTSGSANTIIQLQNTDVNGIRVIAVGDTIGGSSGHGFTIKSAATGTISVIDINQNNTVVSYCDINGVPGVATRGVRMTKATGVTIANNNFFVDGNGISLGGGPGYPLKSISITGNTFTSLGATGAADTNSFVTIEGSDANTITITGNTTNDGMVVQVGPNDTNLINLTISGNTFNTGGILLCEVIATLDPCDPNRLRNVTITGNTFAAGSNGYALLIPSGALQSTVALEAGDVNWASLTFANNKVLRTPGGANMTVDNKLTTGTLLNAAHNWWGSATGPTNGCSGGLGASITTPNTYVTYQPFWITATGTDANCP